MKIFLCWGWIRGAQNWAAELRLPHQSGPSRAPRGEGSRLLTSEPGPRPAGASGGRANRLGGITAPCQPRQGDGRDREPVPPPPGPGGGRRHDLGGHPPAAPRWAPRTAAKVVVGGCPLRRPRVLRKRCSGYVAHARRGRERGSSPREPPALSPARLPAAPRAAITRRTVARPGRAAARSGRAGGGAAASGAAGHSRARRAS